MTSGPTPQSKPNAIADISAAHYPIKISKHAELTTAARRTLKPCHSFSINISLYFFKDEETGENAGQMWNTLRKKNTALKKAK